MDIQLKKVCKKALAISFGLALPLLCLFALLEFYESTTEPLAKINQLQIEKIQKIQDFRKRMSEALSPYLAHNQRISELDMPTDSSANSPLQKFTLEYTIHSSLQEESEKLLKNYKPDYAAIVAMDATTGKILAMASYQKDSPNGNATNLALKATYPAASVFKIVTATAALDKYAISPDTQVAYNGGNHTLYKKNVMSNVVTRWTRNISLRDAFTRSINTVFARLSFEKLQPQDITEYASRFGFNKNFPTDLPLDSSFAEIPQEKNFHLAEIASGYNKITKMSPIQGAMIAASVADDGVMRVPYIIERAKNSDGQIVFESEPVTAAITMSTAGAQRLKELMEATVTEGTGRKAFRTLVKDKKFDELELGGKTGSLHGDDPKGKVDWFVGYAIGNGSKIAVAAVTVNKEKWTVKSTFLAQSMFRKHFGNQFSKNNEKFLSASN